MDENEIASTPKNKYKKNIKILIQKAAFGYFFYLKKDIREGFRKRKKI